MNALIVAATEFEILPLRQLLDTHFQQYQPNIYTKADKTLQLMVTGVGSVQTAYWLGRAIRRENYEIAINAGIAGAFNPELGIGEVVNVVKEKFADLGVEEADCSFTDVYEMGLVDENLFPYVNGWLINEKAHDALPIKAVTGLTINKVHGFQPNIDKIKSKYSADVESMEGASFFYACLMEGIPFLEIRAISNYVAPRNRDDWNVPLAIKNLNDALISLLTGMG